MHVRSSQQVLNKAMWVCFRGREHRDCMKACCLVAVALQMMLRVGYDEGSLKLCARQLQNWEDTYVYCISGTRSRLCPMGILYCCMHAHDRQAEYLLKLWHEYHAEMRRLPLRQEHLIIATCHSLVLKALRYLIGKMCCT